MYYKCKYILVDQTLQMLNNLLLMVNFLRFVDILNNGLPFI